MFPNSITTGDELRASARLPVFLPGEAEPRWLRHRVELSAKATPRTPELVTIDPAAGMTRRLRAAFGLQLRKAMFVAAIGAALAPALLGGAAAEASMHRTAAA